MNKNLFFLPPPQTTTLLPSGIALIPSDIINEVYSVKIAAPSSKDKLSAKDKSKSLTS
ncbi:uncharacterized protein METZ01_LOCUS221752 [marine metagenome]|uniref:Uncharacterized protein n=1 Tax=marine metagenome TaxID=408172 RepID=A0A382G0S9_9ZZZZ